MTPRTVYAYPGSPVPRYSNRKAWILGLAACTGLGFAIGWWWGR